MIVPHHFVAYSQRRDCRKATPLQRRIAVMAAAFSAAVVFSSLFSAVIELSASDNGQAAVTALIAVIVGLAFVSGIVFARVIGRRGKT